MNFTLVFIFILSLFGLGETIYLIKKRTAAQKPICPIGGCERVLTSKYNKTFSVHNDVLGLVFYLAVAVISAFLLLQIGPAEIFALILILLAFSGSLASLYFTYLQWMVIKAWCLWCLGSAVTTWLIALILLIAIF